MWLDLAFEVINKNHISLQREFYTLSYKTNHKFIDYQ